MQGRRGECDRTAQVRQRERRHPRLRRRGEDRRHERNLRVLCVDSRRVRKGIANHETQENIRPHPCRRGPSPRRMRGRRRDIRRLFLEGRGVLLDQRGDLLLRQGERVPLGEPELLQFV